MNDNTKYVKLLFDIGNNRAGIYPAHLYPVYEKWARDKDTFEEGRLIAVFVSNDEMSVSNTNITDTDIVVNDEKKPHKIKRNTKNKKVNNDKK